MTDIIANPRRLTDRIKAQLENLQRSLDELAELIAEAHKGRVWEPLGYADWGEYVTNEFYTMSRLRLSRDERRDLVVSLRSVGMSTRAIGTALGVAKGTVDNDVANSGHLSPDPVTGLDGKTYEPTRPKAVEAEQPIEMLTDEADEDDQVAEPARPSEAVSEFLDSDEDLQQAKYRHEFMKVLCRSDDFMQFDPDKLAELADRELIDLLDNYLTNVRSFVDRFRKATGGLRVVNGGRQ